MTTTEPTTDRTGNDPEFAAFRAGGVFSTAVADAYAGTYGGMYAAVARKLGLTDPVEETEPMRRGLRWEERLADLTHTATGLYVHAEQLWCQHSIHAHHRAIIDGLLSELPEVDADDIDATVQFKTSGVRATLPWDRTVANCQWEIHCTGTARALLVHAVIDDDLDRLERIRFEWIERDDQLIATLIDLADKMWAHIQQGTLPDPDCPAAIDAVKQVTAVADPDAGTVDLADMYEQAARFAELKELVASFKPEMDLLDAQLRARIGSATKGHAPGWDVGLAKPKRVLTADGEAQILAARPDLGKFVLDRDRAKAADRDLYDAHLAPVGARVLTVKPPKENKQ